MDSNSVHLTNSESKLEMWAFRISLTPGPTFPHHPSREPSQIRNYVIEHLRESSEGPEGTKDESWKETLVRKEILEIVTNHLSAPDYRFFITDFEEHPGSWEIAFVVVGAFYGGVCGYGAFRQGLEYIYSDLKSVFETIPGLKTRIRKRFKERHVLSNPRIEPTEETNIENG
jgi:hypothetical protein